MRETCGSPVPDSRAKNTPLLTPAQIISLGLRKGDQPKLADAGGCRFPGRIVICGCSTEYPLEDGACPTCALGVEFAAPRFKTMELPERCVVGGRR